MKPATAFYLTKAWKPHAAHGIEKKTHPNYPTHLLKHDILARKRPL
jgi:hypothetical protein